MELITGIFYAKDARTIWEDLRERLDIVNTSRVYQLYMAIATITQGTNSVSVYFPKHRNLWDEFDSMVPPPCGCSRSKTFVEFISQFLMVHNESYEQAQSEILITRPTPKQSLLYAR